MSRASHVGVVSPMRRYITVDVKGKAYLVQAFRPFKGVKHKSLVLDAWGTEKAQRVGDVRLNNFDKTRRESVQSFSLPGKSEG